MKHIYVGNIGFHISEAGLRSEFEAYGRVREVQVGWNYAVIGMMDETAAERAIAELNSRTAWVLRALPGWAARNVA